MDILLKALFKSLKDKKVRTALVLFSIAVSAALIFANESFAGVCEQKFYQAAVRFAGNSDIRIETRDTAGAEEWIDTGKLSGYQDLFEYRYEFIREKALYFPSIEKMHYFTMIGADIEEFNSYNPLTLSEGSVNDWKGFKAIIGATYAEFYDLNVNDTLKLELGGKEYSFKIAGISEAKGLFTRELADGGFVLVPKETLAGVFNGGTNLIFLKLKDSSTKAAVLERLTKEFDGYQVGYGVNDAVISAETANYVMPFRISAVAVIFMSIFIIFTAFHLITLERIPLIGTLRSIGSSRRKINRLLIAESALLGVIGGVLGCLAGTGVLQIILRIYFKYDESTSASSFIFASDATLTAVLTAVIITVATAILPILGITRIPVKNIILNDVKKKQGGNNKLWILGFLLMLLCMVIPRFLKMNFTSMIIGNTIATGALVGIIPLVPFLARHISGLIGRIPFLSYDVALGVRNVHDNKSLLNNVQLFAVSIAIVAFMASIFNSMGADLVKAYERDMRFDINLVLRHTDGQTLANVSKIEGVEACIGSYRTSADIVNHKTFLNTVYGIENSDFFDYNAVKGLESNRSALASLDKGKNIITTNILKEKQGLKLGDTLVIRFGSREVDYKVTGFVDTNSGIGHIGYISAGNFKEDTEISYYSDIYIKTAGNPSSVKDSILRALTKDVMSINTKEELKAANADKVVAVFDAISIYSYLALIVGLIGIINNIGASFLERKRSLAMLRSVGMGKKSLSRMLVTEAVTMGLYGITFGLMTAVIMSSVIPSIVGLFWGKVAASPAVEQMAVMAAAGIISMLAIAAVPVVKGNRLSIMESIRYE